MRTARLHAQPDQHGGEIALDAAFDFASPAYAELFAASSAGAFQHPIWLSEFWRHLPAARGAEPATIVGRDLPSGRLDFVLPLLRRRKSGVTLLEACDLGVGDYALPVLRAGFEPTPATAARIAAALPAHDVLRIKQMPAPAAEAWRALLGGSFEPLGFSAHALPLAAPYENFAARTFAAGLASQLAKKRKKAASKHGAAVRRLTDAGAIFGAVDRIRDLRRGRFTGDPIQHDAVRDFYAAVAVEGADSGFSRLYALAIDGEDAGFAFNIVQGGTLHYLLIGCDYARFGRHSPGLLLYDGMMRDWLDQGGTGFDFTIGDEPFKAEFGCTATPMHSLLGHGSLTGRLALTGLRLRRQWQGGTAAD